MQAQSNNLLLSGLGSRIRRDLLHGTEPVELRPGQQLWSAGERARLAVFPIDCSISLLLEGRDEPVVDAGLIGREGMLGLPLVLGMPICAFHAIVQGPGMAWCIAGALLESALERHLPLRQKLNRYVCVRLMQLAQAAGCRGCHRVEGRLARWLLLSKDRSRSDELVLTHESLGRVLGVRRAGVTIAAHALQERGLIRYARGHIVVLDVRGLEAAACPCYAQESKTYARLMG